MHEDEVRLTVRIPAELREQIVRLAEKEDRSINAQIVNLLKRAIATAQNIEGQPKP